MGKIIVSDNVSLDGVIQDPAGDEGFRLGGWVGLIKDRPELNKLALDEALGAEALLLEGTAVSPPSALSAQAARRPTLKELTAEYVSVVLREVGGDKAKAAEVLGISKRTLYRWDK